LTKNLFNFNIADKVRNSFIYLANSRVQFFFGWCSPSFIACSSPSAELHCCSPHCPPICCY